MHQIAREEIFLLRSGRSHEGHFPQCYTSWRTKESYVWVKMLHLLRSLPAQLRVVCESVGLAHQRRWIVAQVDNETQVVSARCLCLVNSVPPPSGALQHMLHA